MDRTTDVLRSLFSLFFEEKPRERIPESFAIGESFEEYAIKKLFVSRYYEIENKTHDYATVKRFGFIKSMQQPDFTFRDRITNRQFYVEAKFRRGWYEDKVPWCSAEQLSRYMENNREKPFFLLLGIGDDPWQPRIVSLLPFAEAAYPDLYMSRVLKYRIEESAPISSYLLIDRDARMINC